MPLSPEIKDAVYSYCNNHLADETWYEDEFEFVEDEKLRIRLIQEFQGVRFAYKLYEGIEATDENLIFEVRHQILVYATIYEAVLQYVIYTYYDNTPEFHDLQYHIAPAKIDIPEEQVATLSQALLHNGEQIIPYHLQERKKSKEQVKFADKCLMAKKIGLLHPYQNDAGETIDLPQEIIEIYSCRNAIHLDAEVRKGIQYELDLSKTAYRRMRPFIDQIKAKLQADKKGIYARA